MSLDLPLCPSADHSESEISRFLSIKITFTIPGIESFPSSRATIPFTLVIHVWSLDLDMLVIDVIDKVIHVQKLAVAMNPATLVELHSGR